MPRVRTPKIYWQATQRRVLTMEWIEGVKLTNKVRREGGRARVCWCVHTW
jgi:predicted unusual protein kinase regulating ubiquinone biosynthesis (AarF/ABC1/UbiB family)